MADAAMHQGHCLCGAVQVTARDLGDHIGACFCDLCSRAGGGVELGIEAAPDGVTLTGPVKVHRSSRLAERAWCDTCGSPVFTRYVEGRDAGYMELSPGLFENAAGRRLTRVVYADRAPDGLNFAGPHERVSQNDYEAENPHLNEEV